MTKRKQINLSAPAAEQLERFRDGMRMTNNPNLSYSGAIEMLIEHWKHDAPDPRWVFRFEPQTVRGWPRGKSRRTP